VNVRANDASLVLAATVFQVGLLTDAAAGDIGWSRVPLSKLHAEPARAALERAGATVRTGTGADELHLQGDRPSVRVGGDTIVADAVIVAVPHYAAARLLAGAVDEASSWPQLGASPIVNVHLVYDRRVMDEPVVAGVGTPLQFVFDRTASAGLRSGQCLAVSLSAADEWLGVPSDRLITMADGEVRRLFPAAARAERLDAVVTREQAATFRGVPGTQALRPGPRTALPNVYLAGAWTDTGWPATMEGAVRSGLAAARTLLARPSPTPRSQEVLA
jgi:monoamine oxidase